MSLYCFFKDFAGPLATVSAAGTALFVTLQLGRRQAAAAERQAETAAAKLQADTFRIRLDIYQAVNKLAQVALFYDGNNRLQNDEYNDAIVKVIEGEFVFKPETYAVAKKVMDKSHELIFLEGRFSQRRGDSPTFDGDSNKIDALHQELFELRKSLPHRFRPELVLDPRSATAS